MRPTVRVTLAFLAAAATLLAVLPAASAQDAPAPGLYFTSQVLSVDTAPDSGCVGIPTYAAAPVPPSGGKAYLGFSGEGWGCPVVFQHTAGYDFVSTGKATVKAIVGCDVAGAIIELDYDVSVDGTSIASDRPGYIPPRTCTPGGTADYSVDVPALGHVKAGQVVTVTFVLFGDNPPPASPAGTTPAGNYFIALGASGSGLLGDGMGVPYVPPAPPAGAKTFHQDVSGGAVAIANDFTAATNDTYAYNWTTTATAVDLSFNATVNSGSVTYTVKDGAGKLVATGTLAKKAGAAQPYDKLTAGKWTITVAYSSFRGTFHLNLAPRSATGGTATDTQTLTAGNDSSSSKASPGSDALSLAVAGIAAVLVARRRLP